MVNKCFESQHIEPLCRLCFVCTDESFTASVHLSYVCYADEGYNLEWVWDMLLWVSSCLVNLAGAAREGPV